MSFVRVWLWAGLAVLLSMAGDAAAQTYSHRVYIDADNNAATGCGVSTPAGAVSGAEARLTAIIGSYPATIQSLTLAQCQGGSFGAETPVSAGYNVGYNLGVGGSDVIELALDRAALTVPAGNDWALWFVSTSSATGGADIAGPIVVNGLGGGGAGPVPPRPVLIPAMDPIGLVLLSVVLGIAMIWAARRYRGLLPVLVVAATLSLAGIAWAANYLLDGNIVDWDVAPAVIDADSDESTGDEPPIDIRQAFAARENNRIFFRIDVAESQIEQLIAARVRTALTVAENSPNGTVVGDLRTSPVGLAGLLQFTVLSQLPSAAFAVAPNGIVTVADGSLIDFETVPAFTVRVRATLLGIPFLSADVDVTITVTNVNDAPVINDQTLAVLELAPNGTVVGTPAVSKPDVGQTLTWAITAGNGLGAFAISSTTGEITVVDSADLTLTNSPFVLTVQVTDNGVPPLSDSAQITIQVTDINIEPSFTIAADPAAVNEDAGPQTVAAFATAINDNDGGTQTPYTFSVTANTNAALFAAGPAIDASGTLTYTPAPDANGSALVTVQMQDSGGTAGGGDDTSQPASFTVTVNPVNDAPAFTLPVAPNQTVLQDSGAATVAAFATAISAGPADEAAQVLTFNVSNDNTTLFSTQPAIDPISGDLSFAPAAGEIGTANVTVTLSDNGGVASGGVDTSAPQVFTISVSLVNDPPTFNPVPDAAPVFEDAAPVTVPGFVSGIDDGNPEVVQVVSFNITNNTNPGLFSAAPAIDAAGTLTYSLAPDANGTADITLVAVDDGGTAGGGNDTSAPDTFSITVIAVNDAPSFDLPAAPDQSVLQDSGPATVPGFATNISSGPADENAQTLNFVVMNDNPSLFSVAPSIDTVTGTLTYTPAPLQVGSATVTVTLSDNGGVANGGVDTSAPQQFSIDVTIVNQPPSFTPPADPAPVLEDAGAQTLPAFVTGINDGDPSVVQVVSFSITNNSNPTLFAAGPAIDTAGQLTFTAAANANGIATITFVAIDDGGTANGGNDTSAPDQFVINVTAVNDAPSFSLPGTSNQSVPQDSPAQTVPGFASAILAGPPDEAGQVLSFNVSNDANALFSVQPAINPLNGDLTYTPAAAQVGTANVSVTLSDNGGVTNGGVDTSAAQNFTITLEDVNEVPVPTAVPASPITINENTPIGTPVTTISPNDPDAGQMHTYAIQSGNTGNAFSVDGAGVVSVNGPLNFEGPDDPYSLVVRVTDNGAPVLFADITLVINLADVNEAPVVGAGGTLAYTEGDGPVVLNAAVSVTDPDAGEGIESALVQITGNYANGQDLLGFVNTPNISGVFTPATGTLALTGSDTPAAYQAALASVTFENTSNAPSTLQRTVSWSVNDGALGSNVATSTIDITTVNSDPVITTTGGVTAFVEDLGAVAVDAGLTATDPDSTNASGAVAAINAGFQSGEDVLAFTPVGGITGLYNPVTGVLTLSGTSSFANYQLALRSVTYNNTSNNPDTSNRVVLFAISDDLGAGSAAVSKTVSVAAANDAPVVTPSGATPSFTEGGSAVVVDGGLALSDVDDTNLVSATVSVVAAPDGASESLAASACGGLSVTPGNPLTIAGSAALAAYQACLQSVTYTNASEAPSTTARTVRFVVSDGDDNSNNGDVSLAVVAVNDAPVNGVPGAQSVDEDNPLTFSAGNGNAISVSDVDVGAGTLDVALSATNGTLDVVTGGGATVGGDNTANVTISGTLAQVNAALATTVFNPALNYFGPASLQIVTDDNGNTGTGGVLSDTDSIAITVNPVNDAPTATAKTHTTHSAIELEITAASHTGELLEGAADVDDPIGDLTAQIVAGSELPAGAVVTLVNASDGSFRYDPPGGYSGSGGFQFRICDDGAPTAPQQCSTPTTVTFTITGPELHFVDDSAPAGGDGGLNDPYQSLADIPGARGTGDRIYVFSGTYGSGHTLNANEHLIGQGHSGSSNAHLGVVAVANGVLDLTPAPAAAPSIGGTVTFGGNNGLLRGVAINSGASTGVTATAVTGLTALESSITSTSTAVNFNGVGASTDDVVFTSTTSTGGANGIVLNNLSFAGDGVFNFGSGALSGHSGVSFLGTGTLATVSYAGSITKASDGNLIELTGASTGSATLSGNLSCTALCDGIDVVNRSTGTFNFSGSSKVLNTGTSAAVHLDNNDLAQIHFTGGGLDIDTTSGTGFNAVNGATQITVQGSANTIDATTGVGLNVANSTIGAPSLTFQRISSGGGANVGISLDGTGSSGGLTVTGTGAANSGGVIQNKTGVDGSTTSGIGIYLNNTSNASFTHMQLTNFSNFGVRGFNVNGFTFNNSSVGSSAGLVGDSDIENEGGIAFGRELGPEVNGLTGVVNVNNSVIEDGFENNFYVYANSGTLSQFTMNNTIVRDNRTVSPGNNGLEFRASGSANVIVDVTGSQFLRNRANGVQVTNIGGASVDVAVGDGSAGSGGTFTDNNIGANISTSAGAISFALGNGTFDPSGVGFASPVNINLGVGGTTLSGFVVGNQISNGQSSTGPGIRAIGNGAGTFTTQIQNNSITEVGNFGIEAVARDGSNRLNITVHGNTITLNDPLSADAIRINAGATSTDTSSVCADVNGDNVPANRNTASTIASQRGIYIRERFAGTSFQLEDYAGAAGDLAAVATFLAATNNAPVTLADPAGATFGTIANCPTP